MSGMIGFVLLLIYLAYSSSVAEYTRAGLRKVAPPPPRKAESLAGLDFGVVFDLGSSGVLCTMLSLAGRGLT